jgi:FtsH-binding integral membrane protein
MKMHSVVNALAIGIVGSIYLSFLSFIVLGIEGMALGWSGISYGIIELICAVAFACCTVLAYVEKTDIGLLKKAGPPAILILIVLLIGALSLGHF